MNKQQLIEAVAEASGQNKAVVDQVLDKLTKVITEELDGGSEVVLHGIGKFKPTHRPDRKGRNPLTGAALVIPAAFGVKFSASKYLKDSLN